MPRARGNSAAASSKSTPPRMGHANFARSAHGRQARPPARRRRAATASCTHSGGAVAGKGPAAWWFQAKSKAARDEGRKRRVHVSGCTTRLYDTASARRVSGAVCRAGRPALGLAAPWGAVPANWQSARDRVAAGHLPPRAGTATPTRRARLLRRPRRSTTWTGAPGGSAPRTGRSIFRTADAAFDVALPSGETCLWASG